MSVELVSLLDSFLFQFFPPQVSKRIAFLEVNYFSLKQENNSFYSLASPISELPSLMKGDASYIFQISYTTMSVRKYSLPLFCITVKQRGFNRWINYILPHFYLKLCVNSCFLCSLWLFILVGNGFLSRASNLRSSKTNQNFQ